MRKLIRKILREDEWDFVRYTEAKLVTGTHLCNDSEKFASSHTVVTRVDEVTPSNTPDRNMVYTTDLNTGNHFADPLRVIMEWLKSGEMRMCDPLNESNDMDWIENTNPVPLSSWDKPREGEHLVCLPGFSNISESLQRAKKAGVPALPYGGAGYEEGKVITVDRVSGSTNIGYIVWPTGGPNPYYKPIGNSTDGIFAFALARI